MDHRLDDAYQDERDRVAAQLAEIDTRIKNGAPTRDGLNYGHVGDLQHINSQLAQLLVFLKDEEE